MKTVHYSPCSFAIAGPSTWNALPAPLRNNERSAMSFRAPRQKATGQKATDKRPQDKRPLRQKATERNVNIELMEGSVC